MVYPLLINASEQICTEGLVNLPCCLVKWTCVLSRCQVCPAIPSFFTWLLWIDWGEISNAVRFYCLFSAPSLICLYVFPSLCAWIWCLAINPLSILNAVAPVGTLSAALTPLLLSTKWPSVLLREYNISCSSVTVPGQQARNQMWLTPGDKHFELRQQEMRESTAQGTAHSGKADWHFYPNDSFWYFGCGLG